jgi:hypothetical protein
MPNSNTVAGITSQGTLRNQWPVQTVATMTETIFTVGTDSGTTQFFLTPPLISTVVGAQPAFSVAGNPAITGRSGREYGLPNGNSNEGFTTAVLDPGRIFYVRFVGTGNAGANAGQTLVVSLYQGTSTTLGSDKKIGSTGAAYAAVAGGPFNFYVEAALLWDSTSQILSGSYEANIAFGTGAQYTTKTVIPNVVTAVTDAKLSFLGTIALGNAASSTIQLSEFVIDQN